MKHSMRLYRANGGLGSQTAADPPAPPTTPGKPPEKQTVGTLTASHKCSPCKSFQVLSMPALKREAAWAEAFRVTSGGLSPKRPRPFTHYRSRKFEVPHGLVHGVLKKMWGVNRKSTPGCPSCCACQSCTRPLCVSKMWQNFKESQVRCAIVPAGNVAGTSATSE